MADTETLPTDLVTACPVPALDGASMGGARRSLRERFSHATPTGARRVGVDGLVP